MGGVDWSDDSSTLLNGGITDVATTITVDDTTGFKSAGTIRIGNELIDYTGTTATTFTGCTRAQYDTTASSHSDNSAVYEREVLKHADLNDTFDEIFEQASLNVWYLNSNFYTAYEDWESYSVGAFTTNSDWTVTLSASLASCEIVTGKNLYLVGGSLTSTSTSFSAVITSETLVSDKHTYIPLTYNASIESGSVGVTLTFGTESAQSIISYSGGGNSGSTSVTVNTQILIIAKGSDVYDVYIGYNKVLSGVTQVDPQVAITISGNTGSRGSTGNVTIYDILQSTYTVS